MRRSLYCPSCASYGHAAGRCPTQEMRVDPKGIKKVLQAAGIPSTTQSKNIQALRDLAITSNPPCRLVFGSSEYR